MAIAGGIETRCDSTQRTYDQNEAGFKVELSAMLVVLLAVLQHTTPVKDRIFHVDVLKEPAHEALYIRPLCGDAKSDRFCREDLLQGLRIGSLWEMESIVKVGVSIGAVEMRVGMPRERRQRLFEDGPFQDIVGPYSVVCIQVGAPGSCAPVADWWLSGAAGGPGVSGDGPTGIRRTMDSMTDS